MLSQIVGSVLIAVGIFAIYLLGKSKKNDRDAFILIVLGLVFMGAGGWLLISHIAPMVLLKKFFGIIFVLMGGFLTLKFPAISKYQPGEFTSLGILIGLVLLILGVYMIMF